MKSVSLENGQNHNSTSMSHDAELNGRNRLKVTRACDQCRRNKVKCTGSLPCQNCATGGADCTYDIPYTRGKAPAPKPLPQQLQTPNLEASQPVPTSIAGSTAADLGHQIHDEDLHMLDGDTPVDKDLTDGLNFGSVESTSWNTLPSHHRQRNGFEGTSTIFSDGDAPFPNFGNSFLVLPPQEKAQEMVASYFTRTSGTYQILHPPLIKALLDRIYSDDMSQDGTAMNSSRALILMVFAISQDHEAPGPNDKKVRMGYLYFNLASELLNSASGPPTHLLISTYLLQCFFLLSHSRLNQAYHVLGVATSFIFSSRMNQALDMDKVEAGYIRRAIWGAFTLDKYFATAVGRPIRIRDAEVDQAVLSDSSQSPDAFSLQYRLARSTSLIHTTSYALTLHGARNRCSWTRTIHKDLLSWHGVFEARRGALSNRQSTILELTYLGNMILLHLPFLMKDMDNEEERWDIEQCVKAAMEACSVIETLAEKRQSISWLERWIGYNAALVLYIFILSHLLSLRWSLAQGYLNKAAACQAHIYQPQQHQCSFAARCARALKLAKTEVLAQMRDRHTEQAGNGHQQNAYMGGDVTDVVYDQEAPGGGVLGALLSLVGEYKVQGWDVYDEDGEASVKESILGMIGKGGWTGLLRY